MHDSSTNVRDEAESQLGLDDDDLAFLQDAEHDSSKVVTKSPAKPFQLGYISVFCIIVNKMIGKSNIPLGSGIRAIC